jgi:hypothetical protein
VVVSLIILRPISFLMNMTFRGPFIAVCNDAI